jgi:uncharacterized protein YukE
MSDVMRVDSPGLRQAAPEFAALGVELHTVFRRLAEKLQADGGCWGADAIGQAFAKDYVPASQQTIEAGHEVAGAIEDLGRRLVKAADVADAADARSSRRLS